MRVEPLTISMNHQLDLFLSSVNRVKRNLREAQSDLNEGVGAREDHNLTTRIVQTKRRRERKHS